MRDTNPRESRERRGLPPRPRTAGGRQLETAGFTVVEEVEDWNNGRGKWFVADDSTGERITFLRENAVRWHAFYNAVEATGSGHDPRRALIGGLGEVIDDDRDLRLYCKAVLMAPDYLKKVSAGLWAAQRQCYEEDRGRNPGRRPPITSDIYQRRQKMPKWNVQVSPLSGDYDTGGKILRSRLPDYDKASHLSTGDYHAKKSYQLQAAHYALVKQASANLGGDLGPLISGIVSDRFDETTKDMLRGYAIGGTEHAHAALAHYRAAGMQHHTALARLRSFEGRRASNPPMLLLGNPGRGPNPFLVNTHRAGGAAKDRPYLTADAANRAADREARDYGGRPPVYRISDNEYIDRTSGKGHMYPTRGSNPPSGPADPDAARELELYIENDGDLYRGQFKSIIKNLMAKWARGVYDSAKAVDLFMYLMESGAKKYQREYGNVGEPMDRVFNRNTRLEVARRFRDAFEAEARSGSYGDEYLPKKYAGFRPNTGWSPKTGAACSCRPGIQRDNCPQCEGTGKRIDFAAIRRAPLGGKYCPCGECGLDPARWSAECKREAGRGRNPFDEGEPVTPVMFRVDKAGDFKGDVTAIFPTIPADYAGKYVTSYAHVGQHGSADMRWVMSLTRPALPAEYAALKRELEQIGYRLKVVTGTRATAGRGRNPLNPDETRFLMLGAGNAMKDSVNAPTRDRIATLGFADGVSFAVAAHAGDERDRQWGREMKTAAKIGLSEAMRRKNPSNPTMLPPSVENDPRFKAELKSYRAKHGNDPVAVYQVNVPKGFPKFMTAWGTAPEICYDATKASTKGKRRHEFGEQGGKPPYLVSSVEKGPKFLSFAGGTFRAGKEWILK